MSDILDLKTELEEYRMKLQNTMNEIKQEFRICSDTNTANTNLNHANMQLEAKNIQKLYLIIS